MKFILLFSIIPLILMVREADSYSYACSSNRCLNGGKCIPISVTYATCQCVDGYTGNQCENSLILPPPPPPPQPIYVVPQPVHPIPYQPPSPCSVCQNYASCIQIQPTYVQCICKEGYSGRNCENPIAPVPVIPYHPPAPAPSGPCSIQCHNGGRCIEVIPLYPQCVCNPGYSGRTCDRAIGSYVNHY